MTLEVQETVLSKFCDLLLSRIAAADVDLKIFDRMLSTSDPNLSVGVFPSVWMPNTESYEMVGSGASPSEPTLQQYQVGVHMLTKDSDRTRGLAIHTAYARLVRMVLYRDPTLRVLLGSLTVTDSFGTESYKRGWANSHRYLSKELGQNNLAYLSVLDYTLETEMR